MVVPTPNIKDIMDSTRKSYFLFRSNRALVSEITALKSFDQKLAVLGCYFFCRACRKQRVKCHTV